CLSSIMYCNEVKLEFVTCSEKVWNKIRPRPLVPKMLPSVVQLIIIEYNMFLNDKQLLNIKWHENWVKWSILSTDEDKSIFDCAQEVTKN
ncbi:18602_t:CDS:2, partial [Rhizophagus irregularis]